MTTTNSNKKRAIYHMPGLFEAFEFYREFLPLYREHREYFYDWCEIGSIYGAPEDCVWGGGRVGGGEHSPEEVLSLMTEYDISSRLTFSNSLLTDKHLADSRCNDICQLFDTSVRVQNGVIVHSDILQKYIREKYPNLYLVSSTTKVITDYDEFYEEVKKEDFRYVVPDFRLNKRFSELNMLTKEEKNKVEFLCNECCNISCKDRKECYEVVSRRNLGETDYEFPCSSPDSEEGYRFSKAMKNQSFIGIKDIKETYLSMGFTNFKIEGRGLGTALLLEFILYYMTKPDYQLLVREYLYLDSMLDLF